MIQKIAVKLQCVTERGSVWGMSRRGGSTPAGLGVTIPFGMSPIETNILACRQIVLCLFAIALHPNADRAKASAGGI
jgi:hypothetical protein